MRNCHVDGKSHKFEITEVVEDTFNPGLAYGHDQKTYLMYVCSKCGYQLEVEDYNDAYPYESQRRAKNR